MLFQSEWQYIDEFECFFRGSLRRNVLWMRGKGEAYNQEKREERLRVRTESFSRKEERKEENGLEKEPRRG